MAWVFAALVSRQLSRPSGEDRDGNGPASERGDPAASVTPYCFIASLTPEVTALAWPNGLDSSIETGVGLKSPGYGCVHRLRLFSVSSDSSFRRSGGAPMIGRRTERISSASVTGVAPCLMRLLVPSARGSSGEPGTAKTSRPCSSASRAVISEPETLENRAKSKSNTQRRPICRHSGP